MAVRISMCGESIAKEGNKAMVVSFIQKLHKGNQLKMLNKVFSLGFSLVLPCRISVIRVVRFGTVFRYRPLGKMHYSTGQLWPF